MVEKASRVRVGDEPRGDPRREWEIFIRDDDGPLRHVGSVTAETAQEAHEHATKLFGWFSDDVWLCPADQVHRYSMHTLDDDAEPATPEDGTEPRTLEYE